MKSKITYIILALIFYSILPAQSSSEIREVQQKLSDIELAWHKKAESLIDKLTAEYKSLQKELKAAVSRLEFQSEHLTQLEIKSIRDSLKINRLEKQIEYTQSFIKDSIAVVVEDLPESINLLDDVKSMHKAWKANEDHSYSYNASVANYQYIYFSLKENLQPKTTYNIAFNIVLESTNKEALLKGIAPTTSDKDVTIYSDSYFKNGEHIIVLETGNEEIVGINFRARNNDGGSFIIKDIKVSKK